MTSLPLLLLSLFLSSWASQEILQGPEHTSVHIGHTAILPCKVTAQKGSVQWMKNGFGLGTDRPLRFFPRYSMVGSIAKGEYNLKVVNASMEDDDIYACQISEADGERSVISSTAKLTILVRPSPPVVVGGASEGVLEAIGGKTLSVSCISKGGKPSPSLGWALSIDPLGRQLTSWLGESRTKFSQLFKQHNAASQESLDSKINEEVHKDGYLMSVVSNISFVPRPEDDKKYLLCISHHETLPDRVELSGVRLSLRYAPRVQLAFANQGRLREGSSALLACNVDAKPMENLSIAWYRNRQRISKHTTDTLAFEELKLEDHDTEYTCESSNSIGTSKNTIKLDVAFAPRISSRPQEKEANLGESVTFQCEAIGNPPPQIFWTRKDDEQIVGRGETLQISEVNAWQEGEYVCTAIVESFEHATLSHHLYIRGPPSVWTANEEDASIGSQVELFCKIGGRPKAKEIVWLRNGDKLAYISGKHQIQQATRSYGMESRLIIKDFAETDVGVYNCSANNGLGEDSSAIKLRKRTLIDMILRADTYLLYPLIAILLLLSLCLCLCVICRRRRYSKSSGTKFIDDQSDVTVKCEALDVQYYPDMYGSPLEGSNIMTSKDYISIPQNNPDMDFVGSNNMLYPKYMEGSEYNGRFEPHSYGSFMSGVSTPNGFSTTSNPGEGSVPLPQKEKSGGIILPPGAGYGVDGSPLEPLQEVETPKVSTYSFASQGDPFRPLSRTSTHV